MMGEGPLPKITVIIAQKNHHTKLFQADTPEKNVPPGTVVDTSIVNGRHHNFYMCAHNGIIGTSRPVHYHVLVDEIGFGVDDLQQLVLSLSYVYQRSNSAISIVAPIAYAHHAAAQLSQFIKFEDYASDASSGEGVVPPVPELPLLNTDVQNSMFFC
ncbi:Argonaute family protein [Rhynchospora pubera]|uniref:Argonaute family protein n=1 Tax=Rhynchospora pubera TaxID=906938 RepID=A0AAV8G199_9POAL|nr:Argonaute family protein [Rhynchospora pubera]